MGSQLPRCYVTREFRESMVESHPRLDHNPAYWRLAWYLVFGTHLDAESGRLVLSNRTLAEIAGKEHQHSQNNFYGKHLLEDFKSEVAPGFKYEEWAYVDGRARTVLSNGLDPRVHVWAEEMVDELVAGADVVDVVTGKRRTKQMVNADDQEALRGVTKLLDDGVADATRQVITYQNALDKQAFTRVAKENLPPALAKAKGLENEASRRQARITLANIGLRPRPLIRPVARSPRAFSVGPSLLTLKSSLRRVFTRRWVDYDLKSAQLAIVGRQWGFEPFLDFVESHASVWDYLADVLGLPQGASKGFIKTAIYSLVFGASKSTIAKGLEEASGVFGIGERFFRCRFVKEVYSARERRVERILKDGGGSTALGKVIRIDPGQSLSKRRETARSILAQQAQATELLLVQPIYDVASGNNQFKVMLYQFDGVTIRFRDPRNWGRWHRHICRAVDERARHLKVDTQLEWTRGSDFDWV